MQNSLVSVGRKSPVVAPQRLWVMLLAVVLGVVGLQVVAAPANAAPVGAFGTLDLIKTADGFQISGTNPVDNSATNDIVAINDSVGLQIHAANPTSAVTDAIVSITKPSCFIWETTALQALTFSIDSGQTTGAVTSPSPWDVTANTINVNWTQKINGDVTTAVFRAQAGPTCADGTTWTPTVTYTDASGTYTKTTNTVTVRSTAGSDLVIQHVGTPVAGTGEFGIPGFTQRWDITLSPETISKVGYTDPSGNVSIQVTFSGPLSVFSIPRKADGTGTPNVNPDSGCWKFTPYTPYPAGVTPNSPGAQTFTLTMSKNCASLLTQTNRLVVYSNTTEARVEAAGCAPTLTASVSAPTGGWTDVFGTPIPDVPLTNNSDSVALACQDIAYEYTVNSHLWSPINSAPNWASYPYRVYSAASAVPSSGAALPSNDWRNLSNSGNDGFVGAQSTFMSVSHFEFTDPSLTNIYSYHLFDPTLQQVDLANISKSTLSHDGSGSVQAVAFPAASYTVQCTTGFVAGPTAATAATAANSAGTLTWVDCATLPQNQISGVRFNYPGSFTGTKVLDSQVPMIAVGPVGSRTVTTHRWTANDITETTRGAQVAARIVGNVLQLAKSSTTTQVQPQADVPYVLTPTVANPNGTFSPVAVPNLKVVDVLPLAANSVDFSQAQADGWTVTETPANLGVCGVAYACAGQTGITLTFTRAGVVDTTTTLPTIKYIATIGTVLPPNNASVTNNAVISADYSSGNKTAALSIPTLVPSAVFFGKHLISAPVIQVEDTQAAWQIDWANYNTQSVGKGTFVDILPYSGDANASSFSGTAVLSQIATHGSGATATIEMTTANPATIGQAPAASTVWVAVTTNPASWPANPTAVRITLGSIASGAGGYGAVDLHFTVNGQKEFDVYGNSATGNVYNPLLATPADVYLGQATADPVRVVASSVGGVAWIDKIDDGIRADTTTEPRLANVKVDLYRAGVLFRSTTTDANGAYVFNNLHSDDYQVRFDPTTLNQMGYKITANVRVGTDTTIDSDADPVTGQTPVVTVPIDTTPLSDVAGEASDIRDIDAGVISTGLVVTSTQTATVTHHFDWSIAKSHSAAVVTDDTADIAYTVAVTQGAMTSAATLTGTMTVTNPSDDTTYVFDATIVADGTGITCTVTNGTNLSIAPSVVIDLAFSCVGDPGTDMDRVLTLTTTPTSPAGAIPSSGVANVTYALTEVDKTITVNDTQYTFSPAWQITWSAEGTVDQQTYTLSVPIPSGECVAISNVATGVSDDAGSAVVATAGDDANVCAPADLVVSKNVITSMSRTYGWSIEKSITNADTAAVDPQTGTATVDYQVVVTEGDFDDAVWAMSGQITVQNPNSYKSVTADITDGADIGGGAQCVVAGGEAAVLAPNETRIFDYTCTFTSQPAYDGTNTAKAHWMTDVAGESTDLTESRDASGTAAIEASAWVLNDINRTASVTDTAVIDGVDSPVVHTFGPYTWSAVGTTHVETYSLSVNVSAGTCAAIANTAGLDGLGLDSSASIQFCREAPLTITDSAAAALTRTYNWSIDKKIVNEKELTGELAAGSVGVNYQVEVTDGTSVDSLQKITGQVVLTNPNDFMSRTVDVSGEVDISGLTCTYSTSVTAVTIPVSGQVTLPYTCVGDPEDVMDGIHTAGFELTDAVPSDEPVTATAAFTYVPTEVNKSVTLSDISPAFGPSQTVTWVKEGTVHTVEYTDTVTLTQGVCRTVDNTASLEETEQSASTSVAVCAAGVTPPVRPTTGSLALTGAGGVGGALGLGLTALLLGLVILIYRRRAAVEG